MILPFLLFFILFSQIFLIIYLFKKRRKSIYFKILLIIFMIVLTIIIFIHIWLASNNINYYQKNLQEQIKKDEIAYYNNAVLLSKYSPIEFFKEIRYVFSTKYNNVWPFFISLIYRFTENSILIIILIKMYFYIGTTYIFSEILDHLDFQVLIKKIIFVLFCLNPIYIWITGSLLRGDIALFFLISSFYFYFIRKDFIFLSISLFLLFLFRIPIGIIFIIILLTYILIIDKKIYYIPWFLLVLLITTSVFPRWGIMGIKVFNIIFEGDILGQSRPGGQLTEMNPFIVLLVGPIIGIIGGSPFFESKHLVSHFSTRIFVYSNILFFPFYILFIMHFIVNSLKMYYKKSIFLFLFPFSLSIIYGYIIAYKGFPIRNTLMWQWTLYLMMGYILNKYKSSNLVLSYSFFVFVTFTASIFYYINF